MLRLVLLDRDGELTLVMRPFAMRVALALPYFVPMLTLATIGGAVVAWWKTDWSLFARLHQTVPGILGIRFTWHLFELGFVSI